MVLRRPAAGRAFAAAPSVVLVLVLAACATTEESAPERPMTASEGRAFVARLLPDGVRDRSGWATDLYAAFAALEIPVNARNACAAIAVTAQESGFAADPVVPGLSAIAWKEIEARRERAGIPRLVLDAALALESPDGRTYRRRLDTVRTERELSAIYEDFIGMVPLAGKFLASRNPVRTGGPMQVGIAFAEEQTRRAPYPYPVDGSIRHEVFTRRGGLYFGVAHLLDYRAPYDRELYRFADYNAGRYASRNAAFQAAVSLVSGIPLATDGDVLRYDGDVPQRDPSATERAVRVLARRLDLDDAAIRRDLEVAPTAAFERTRVYERTMALADRAAGKPVPRAVVPQIALKSPKITRPLTTEWFSSRVQARYEACLARAARPPAPQPPGGR